MHKSCLSFVAMAFLASPVLAKEPAAEAQKVLWCKASLAAAAQYAEAAGDKSGAASVVKLVGTLGMKAAALLTADGFSEKEKAELDQHYADKALADRENGVFSYTQQECLIAATD